MPKRSNPWKGRRVLVTGATGLLGPWLIEDLLRRQAKVTAFVRSPEKLPRALRGRLSVFKGRLEDLGALSSCLRRGAFKTVFHLGGTNANFGKDCSPLEAFESNIRGAYNLLEACRRAPRPLDAVLVASSREARARPGPRHPHEVSKKAAEDLCRAYRDTYGLPVTAVRCPNVYGGGDLNAARLIPGTIRRVLRGQAPELRSDGSPRRSYVYAPDMASALLTIASRGSRFAIVEFTGLRPVAVRRVADMIVALARLRLRPRHTLSEGLTETLEWHLRRRGRSAGKARRRKPGR